MEKISKIGVSGFLMKDNKILIVKRSETDRFLPGKWEMPGGRVEFDENPARAIEREYIEETGLKVRAIKPIALFSYTYIQDDENRHVVDITYLLELKNNDSDVKLSSEHSEYKWVSKEEIDSFQVSENMKNCILEGFKNS